ncbi:MAG: transglycosylase SLT domain-containing protein [Elusimicrobiota bacterium]|nr:transglycosylase SLT domain-containing protein [Elusimicrobiota bacterium]
MKTFLILLTALVLAAPARAQAESFSQLSDSLGAEAMSAPEPSAAQAAVEDPSAQTAGVDFLVRPDAQHEPGAELFSPWRMSEKAAGGAPKIPYFAIAKAEAKEQGVDLALVLAVIQKESSFDPKAHSSVGAKGLMQLMPETATWLGLKDTSQLFSPAVNIKYGVKYLKFLWNEFAETAAADISGPDMNTKASQMAIAAYNAGQGNVRKYNGVPPFKETRNYVTKVTQYFGYYEDLLLELAAGH